MKQMCIKSKHKLLSNNEESSISCYRMLGSISDTNHVCGHRFMVNPKPSLLAPSWSTCHIQAFHTTYWTGQSGTKQICLVTLSWSVTHWTTTLVRVNIVRRFGPARPCSSDLVTFIECASFKWKGVFKVTAKLWKTSHRILSSIPFVGFPF